MKNNINLYSICAVAFIFSLGSCKKFLHEEPLSSFSEQAAFDNVPNAKNAVIGAYSQLAGQNGYGNAFNNLFAVDSDEWWGTISTSVGDNNVRDLASYNATTNNAGLEAPFKRMYVGIERANICIKNIPGMSLYTNGTTAEKAELKRLYGEALTLRAQYLFEVVKVWGDMPAQFVPSADMPDLNIPKMDRDSIYNHLLDDLLLAQTLVPWRNDAGVAVDERITKGAVKGLRARIALFRGGYSLRRANSTYGQTMARPADYKTYYQIAKTECAEIMQRRDKHALNPSFKSVFKDAIDAHKIEPNGEVMFEVAHAGGGSTTDSKAGYSNGPKVNNRGSNTLIALPTYFYAFDSTDTRRDVTIAAYNVNADYTKVGQTLVRMNDGKFRRDWFTNPTPSVDDAVQYFGINHPLLRFSDVLLMFAEADNELSNGPTAAAKSAYEEVRLRAFGGNASLIGNTPTDYLGFFNAIVNERWLEFGGEGIRKYDLIRWNMLAQKLVQARDNMTKMKDRLAPYNNLPQAVYYKNASFDLLFSASLYQPSLGSTPTGYTKINWAATLTPAIIANTAPGFKPNHSELQPIPQSALTNNPNLSQDYGY